MKKSIYKKIPNCPGYFVSVYGQVRSEKNSKSKQMKLSTNNGYKYISLRVNNVSKNFLVHRLVAMCFLNNWDETKQVNHIDGNKSNNYYKNLEMVNCKENISHHKGEYKLYEVCIKETGEIKMCKSYKEVQDFCGYKTRSGAQNIIEKGENKKYIVKTFIEKDTYLE